VRRLGCRNFDIFYGCREVQLGFAQMESAEVTIDYVPAKRWMRAQTISFTAAPT